MIIVVVQDVLILVFPIENKCFIKNIVNLIILIHKLISLKEKHNEMPKYAERTKLLLC
jgi:hypothetical protein